MSNTLSSCWQEVPEKSKESPGGPWQFVGLLPLFDPPRHDSGETIRQALNLGVNVKMITGISSYSFIKYCKTVIQFFILIIARSVDDIQVINLPLLRRLAEGLEWELTCTLQRLYLASKRIQT